MSKSKNKGKEPQQNVNKSKEDLEVKVEEINDSAAEVTGEEAAEETAEKAEEVIEEAASEESGAVEEVTEAEEDGEVKEEKAEISIPDPVSEEEAKENAEFRKLHFVEKCKKDPIIPVCIILSILALIVAGLYFMLPNATTPSMGLTLSDFQTRYNEGLVAQSLMNNGIDITFRTPEYVDITSTPSVLGDKAVISAKRAYADFFNGPFKYYSIGGVEGAARKSDGNLSYIRVYIQYGDGDFNTVWLYASNVASALYPDLNKTQAMDVGMKAMNEYDGDARFYVRGDFAFRLVAVKKAADGGGEIVYIVVDCVPRSVLNESQIREDLDGMFVSEESASVTETSAATT